MAEGRVIVVAGPTASGKSALALALAERRQGTVINADAMQTYDAFPILTAQPTTEERARVPHALYGVLPLSETLSAARWRTLAAAEVARALGDKGAMNVYSIVPSQRSQATVSMRNSKRMPR